MSESEILYCLRTVFPKVEWNIDQVANFLKTIGLMNPNGVLYHERAKKLYEVLHFSSHVVKCIDGISRRRDVALLDCGCGRSYLPFFLNYVLSRIPRRIRYMGVDSNANLIEKSAKISTELGFTNMQFFQSSIIDFDPKVNVNVVCALHACDTATDESIAKAVELNARFVVVAPCCQRQIIRQLGRTATKIPALKSLLESRTSKEQVGVALTETLRKLALESFGYKVDMFEFVSTKHTPKNIMLRAEKLREWNNESLNTYKELRDYFNVKPRIQEHLIQLE